jgi:hypothetical protein
MSVDDIIEDLVDLLSRLDSPAEPGALVRIASYRIGEYTGTVAFCGFVSAARRYHWLPASLKNKTSACIESVGAESGACLEPEDYTKLLDKLITYYCSKRRCEPAD